VFPFPELGNLPMAFQSLLKKMFIGKRHLEVMAQFLEDRDGSSTNSLSLKAHFRHQGVIKMQQRVKEVKKHGLESIPSSHVSLRIE
jgi:hypothetical protein